MRWKCDSRRDRKKLWHRWFAWYPVHMGYDDCRWFEQVERKGTYHISEHGGCWIWEYRNLTLDTLKEPRT